MTNELAKPLIQLPNSVESEKYIIGCCLLDETNYHNHCSILTHFEFYDLALAKIYKAITELSEANKNIDMVTVTNKLMERQDNDVNWAYACSQVTISVAGYDGIEYHVKVVIEKATMRKMFNEAGRIINLINSSANFDSILAHYKNIDELASFDATSEEDILFKDIIEKSLKNLEKRTENVKKGINTNEFETGIKSLDKIVIEKGDLIIIAGRPSMGKTAYALFLTRCKCATGNFGAFFSLEMTKTKLCDRIIVAESKINKNNYRFGKLQDYEWEIIENKGIPKIIDYNLFIYDSTFDFEAIKAKCRKLKKAGKLDFVVIDYITLMTTVKKFARKDLEIGYYSTELKKLAKELDIPIILLSQLNRGVDSRTPPIPMMSDLRESGSIEQDADIIILTYREDYYNERADPNWQNNNEMDLIIGKYREGSVGQTKTKHDGTLSDFFDINAVQGSELFNNIEPNNDFEKNIDVPF